MAAENSRRHARASIPMLVQYRYGALDPLRTDYAINVSKSGLFINTDADYPLGARIHVLLTTRDGLQFLQGEGEVVRVAGGCAIELVGFDAEAQEVLDRLVQQALAEQEKQQVGPATRRAQRRGDQLSGASGDDGESP